MLQGADALHVGTLTDGTRDKSESRLHDQPQHHHPASIDSSCRLETPSASFAFIVSQWHVIDGPSFPLESKKYPQLSNKGKYCDDCVYTVDDVRALIAFANDRGVRVIPELGE